LNKLSKVNKVIKSQTVKKFQ